MASWLLPRRVRSFLLAFYQFARGADEIADHPALAPEEKRAQLQLLERAMQNGTSAQTPHWAQPYAQTLQERRDLRPEAGDLLRAFFHDIEHTRCRDWQELVAYCRLSAVPVGRTILKFHGQSPLLYPAADALCSALQILNHIQDCREDYLALGRSYLPQQWLEQAGLGRDALAQPSSSHALRGVIDRTLDHVDRLLESAAPLPWRVEGWRLKVEIACILAMARALAQKLRREDPLAHPVRLSQKERWRCVWEGLSAGMRQ